MKLKVCGLSNSLEVETCVSLNVNYCGFILNYPKSHRYISLNKAKDLTNINKGNTKYVGVLVKPTFDELNKFSKLNLDYFQLYGDFSSKELIKIKEKFNLQQSTKDFLITSQLRSVMIFNKNIKAGNYQIDTYKKKIYIYGIAFTSDEKSQVIEEAKEILDVEDVISSIILVDELRIQKD